MWPGGPLVHAFAQILAPAEEREQLLGHIHLVAGLGIAARIGPVALEQKAAESADFHFVRRVQGILDVIEKDIDGFLGDLVRLLGQNRQLLDQLGFVHGAASGFGL